MSYKFRDSIAVKLATVSVMLVASAAVLTDSTGCVEKPDLPPVAYCGPTLASADLGLSDVECDPTGYVILEKERSQGRFPAALASVRLEPHDPFDTSGTVPGSANTSWQVATIPEEEAVAMNALFNTVPAVREVVVLDQLSVVLPDVNLDEMLKSVRRLEVSLCLVFGPRTTQPGYAALAGVLLDVETRRHVAYLQAQAGSSDVELPRTDRIEEDERHRDVNHLAARKFEQQVRSCVLELIGRDRPIATTQPSPWHGAEQPEAAPIYILPNQRVGW